MIGKFLQIRAILCHIRGNANAIIFLYFYCIENFGIHMIFHKLKNTKKESSIYQCYERFSCAFQSFQNLVCPALFVFVMNPCVFQNTDTEPTRRNEMILERQQSLFMEDTRGTVGCCSESLRNHKLFTVKIDRGVIM